MKSNYLHFFKEEIDNNLLPDHFTQLSDNAPHPLCILAAEEVQEYLNTQQDWSHNFGLSDEGEGAVIGKMFGVLVVKTAQGAIGYLAAFSGKLAKANDHLYFVPPVFDGLAENGFLTEGMQQLTQKSEEIAALEALNLAEHIPTLRRLKEERKNHSTGLQQQLFDQYHFLNKSGEEKSLHAIFRTAGYKNPPSGSGECAGPKLLQHAFQYSLQPLILAEFWWGQSPKSDFWKHGAFYPCCKEKCEPILGHMLVGIDK